MYLKHKPQIKKGEKWMLRMGYTFCYGLMIKMHESMFGMICYGLLMQFSCLNFNSVLGVFSFLAAILCTSYLAYFIVAIYQKLNGAQ